MATLILNTDIQKVVVKPDVSSIIWTGTLDGTSGIITDFVTNACDTWTGTAKVTCIATLSQAEYDAIGTKDENTLYIII